MLLPTLLLLASVGPPSPPGFSQATLCHNLNTVSTPALRSSSGFRILLQLHTEDDHGKNTHLCESDYTLRITHPDGTERSADGFFGNDDAWDRPISFELVGFSKGGNSAVIHIAEGGAPQPIDEILIYDLVANTWEIGDLAGSLKARLSSACRANLRVLGTTSTGDAVVAAPDRPECQPGSRWQITVAGSDTGEPLAQPATPLSRSATILPLDLGTPAGH